MYIVQLGPSTYPIFYLAKLAGRAELPKFYIFEAITPEHRRLMIHESAIWEDSEYARVTCKIAANGLANNTPKK